MTDSSTQSITIAAPAQRVAAVIRDFASYPRWAEAVKETEVVRVDEAGLPRQVRFVLDAGVMKDEYTLCYDYSDDLRRIQWHLQAPSRMQRAQTGSYEIVDNGDGTSTVTYTLAVDLAVGMLGMFRRKAEKAIMDAALKQLKRRVETSDPVD